MPRSALLLIALAVGCGGSGGGDEDPGPDAGTPGPDAAPPGPCNPIIGDDCATPFPSSFYLVPAAGSATGYRVKIPPETLPVTAGGTVIRPDRFDGKDGFSPSSQFTVYFAAGVNAAQLPSYENLAASVSATSTVQVIDWETGERVPLFAELDANALEGEQTALIIRPQVRLRPARRYVIALVKLSDGAGKPLAPAPFKALRDRATLPAGVAPLKTRYEEIFTRLQGYGIARADLSLAWDIVTASDATLTSHLVGMRDAALARVDSGELGFRVVSTKELPKDANVLRELQLAVQAPWYLDDHSLMTFDSDGRPKSAAIKEFPVTVEIPRCAATATKPLPLVVFGHGLFGNAADTLAYASIRAAAQQNCMILFGTDWLGLSTVDLPIVVSEVLPDLNHFYVITDRLQQGHVNTQVMARMFKTRIKDDPALALDGKPITDGSEIYYFGISLGGVNGGTFMALSPDVERGVLNVPGCEWSLMLFRSTQFNPFYALLGGILPNPLDRQLLLNASQTEWDYSDPASFAPHMLADPLPGVGVKHIILQESIGDAQVPNMATRILARTMGLSGMGLVEHVYGIPEVAGPVDSAYTQWDRHIVPKPPATNVPAPSDNGAHNAIQDIPQLLEQVRTFFRPDGRATNTCGGPCDFP